MNDTFLGVPLAEIFADVISAECGTNRIPFTGPPMPYQKVQNMTKKCTCTYATSANTKSVRLGFELGGYVLEECDTCKQEKIDGEKFVSPCPPPTPYQSELLDILIEECAEVIQRATKMKRFGVQEVQPDQHFSNVERLSHEVGDLTCMLELCEDEGLITYEAVKEGARSKERQLAKFMQTSKETKNVHS